MADTLPPQPETNNPTQWPASLDMLALAAAIQGDPGPLNYPDPPAVYAVDDAGTNSHSFYKFQNIWQTTTGMDVLPTGNADQTSQSFHTVIQSHMPFSQLFLLFTAQRFGAKPKRPSTDLNNPNFICVKSNFSSVSVIPYPNGVCLFRISGCYWYKLLAPMTEQDVYPIGVTPIETAKSTDKSRLYSPCDIDKTMLDYSAAIPSGTTFPQIIVESPPTPATELPLPIYIPPR